MQLPQAIMAPVTSLWWTPNAMQVSFTTTINTAFGSKILSPSTGEEHHGDSCAGLCNTIPVLRKVQLLTTHGL